MDREAPEYDLGVLIVHGIGNQRQGQTLADWADAIVRWLDSWSIDERVTWRSPVASIPEATIKPGGDEPAHLTMQLRFAEDGSEAGASGGAVESQRWLMAEGWWAGTFDPPSFGELWSWSFVSVPATAAMHANAVVRSSVARFRFTTSIGQRLLETVRILAMLVTLVALVMVSPVILAFFTVLLVGGIIGSLIPIDGVRMAVAKAQLAAIGTIGDTKRLTGSPTQAGAIKAPIADGIRWLRENGCDKVVVVAHSQGAAVTYKTLHDLAVAKSDGDPEASELVPIDSFVTVGSGLPKVHALEHLSRASGPRNLRTASLLVPAAAVIASVALRELRRTEALSSFLLVGGAVAFTALMAMWAAGRAIRQQLDEDESFGMGAFVDGLVHESGLLGRSSGLPRLLIGIGVIASVVAVFAAERGLVALWAALAIAAGVWSITLIAVDSIPPLPVDLYKTGTRRWLDLYAGRDPVPAGPTVTTRAGWPSSWRVSNLGSIARDHNTYTSNADECLTFVGVELLEIAGVEQMQADRVRERTANYGFIRRWRVGWRMIATWAALASSAIFAIRTRDGATDTLADWYDRVFTDGGLVDRWWPFDLPGFVPDALVEPWSVVAAVLAYLLVAAVSVQVVQSIWAAWDAQQSRVELGPGEAGHGAPPAFVLLVGLTVAWAVFAISPAASIDTWQRLDLSTWSDIGRLVLGIGLLLGLAAVLPLVLRSSHIQEWVMGRYNSRVEAKVQLGEWLLSQGDVDGSIEAFEDARDAAADARWGAVHVDAGLLRAMGLSAQRDHLLPDADVDHVSVAAAAARREALVGRMRRVRGISDRAWIAMASEYHALEEPKRAKGALGRVRVTNRSRADFVATAIALDYDGQGAPILVDGADPTDLLAGMLPDQQLHVGFALLARGIDPTGSVRAMVRQHLAAGVRAPDIDLRTSLAAAESVELDDLAREILGFASLEA